MWSHHVLVDGIVNRPWLSPTFLIILSLLLQPLSMLLIGLDQLDLLLAAFSSVLRLVLVLESYLFLSYAMGIWRLQRGTHVANAVLHEVLLAQGWVTILVLGGLRVLVYSWGSHAIAQGDLRILHLAALVLNHCLLVLLDLIDVQRLDSSVVLSLLLESHLSLMAFVVIWASVSSRKLVLDLLDRLVLILTW